MKKIISCMLLSLIVLLCISCAPSESPAETDRNTEKPSADGSAVSDKDTLYQASGSFASSEVTTVSVVSDRAAGEELYVNVYIYAEISEKEILECIGQYDRHSITTGRLSASDIDNDGTDELILNMEISGNGGTLSHIYEYENGSFVLSCDIGEALPAFGCFAISDRKLSIVSESADFTEIISVSRVFGDAADDLPYDSEGVLQVKMDANAVQIYTIEAEQGKLICTAELDIYNEYCFDVKVTYLYDGSGKSVAVSSIELAGVNSAR